MTDLERSASASNAEESAAIMSVSAPLLCSEISLNVCSFNSPVMLAYAVFSVSLP